MLDETENKASRGSVPQIILTILEGNERYGYEICKEIERITKGELVLKQPSLYSSLRRLEAQGLISSKWQDSDIGGKRHYYFLTENGKNYLEQNKENWHLNDLIAKLPTNTEEQQHKYDNNFSVASQETLFGTGSLKPDIKRIDEDKREDKKEFFFQFDLFDQNVKSIKTSSTMNVDKIEKYSNKYESLDNNQQDIEPKNEEKDVELKGKILEQKSEIMNDNEQKSKGEATEKFGNVSASSFWKEPIVRGESLKPSSTDSSVDSFESQKDAQNAFERDTKSNFDLGELVAENSHTSPLDEEITDKDKTSFESNEIVENADKKVGLKNITENEKNYGVTQNSNENANVKVEEALTQKNGDEKIANLSETKTNEQNDATDLPKPDEKKQKIVRENVTKSDVLFESNDYRSVIGKLFSNSQKSDPYEQNKYNSFKEIFPQTKIENIEEKKKPTSEIDAYVQSSSDSNIDSDDMNVLSNLFSLQGLTIKKHNANVGKNSKKVYTDKNKLNMVSAWITSFLMAVELIFSYIFLQNGGSLLRGQKLFFFLGAALTLSIFIIATLENLFDRYKLVIIKNDFKKGLTLRLLCFIIIAVVTFAINLAFGMESLGQVEFLTYWLLPILLSSNIIVFYLIYSMLLSHKYFNS
jgi:PadR family transcriptional regulator PadR